MSDFFLFYKEICFCFCPILIRFDISSLHGPTIKLFQGYQLRRFLSFSPLLLLPMQNLQSALSSTIPQIKISIVHSMAILHFLQDNASPFNASEEGEPHNIGVGEKTSARWAQPDRSPWQFISVVHPGPSSQQGAWLVPGSAPYDPDLLG